ncbi:MAG TPA: ferritin-like domain-containing protein [Acidimicrobiales bacterium]|nr:ferritin-like domain-containing protein [Acidimicrobiales bacterium]
MNIDERGLNELMVESQDLQVDAMRDIKATLPELAEIREERRGEPVNTDEIDRYNSSRRQLLQKFGLGAGGLATRGLFAGGMGSFLAGLLASPASADKPLDIQILQTASSLEILAVGTYDTALGLEFIKNGNPVVVAFAQTTRKQHDEHNKAFQAQSKTLGGKEQTQPNPKFAQVVQQALPTIKGPVDVVGLAKTLEMVATETYLMNTSQLEDTASKKVMASIMGVETQHAATLAAVEALLKGGAPQLIKIPIGADAAKLPAAAGSVAFPEAFLTAKMVAEPESGAVK